MTAFLLQFTANKQAPRNGVFLFSIPSAHDSCSSSLQVPYALSSLQRVCGWPSPHNFKPNRHIFHMSNVVKFGILTTKAAELLFSKKNGHDWRSHWLLTRAGCSTARFAAVVLLLLHAGSSIRYWLCARMRTDMAVLVLRSFDHVVSLNCTSTSPMMMCSPCTCLE